LLDDVFFLKEASLDKFELVIHYVSVIFVGILKKFPT